MIRSVLSASIALLIATPALASGGEDAGLLYPLINLVLLIAALIYFARKPVLEFFNDRRGKIQNDLKKSSDLLGEAEAKFASWQRKLADLDQELETIRETSRQRAENERANIIADATASAERIRADASAAIEQELRRSRVNAGDRERLVGEFIERIEQPTTSGTGEVADR